MTDFIPAASFHFLTPFYDGFVRLFFGKRYREMISKISAQGNEKILDIGCGPGNILILMQEKYPNAKITGLDIDPRILKIAQKKIQKRGLTLELKEANATELPFPDVSFDIAVSTFVIHHLATEDKKKMLVEAFRVLKPGGKFYLFDFGPPQTKAGKIASKIYRYFEEVNDGVSGKYWDFLKEAGFQNLHALAHTKVFLLEFELIEAAKP